MASDRVQRQIERLLDQIENEADQENWQRVLDLANEVLRFAPDNGDAHFLDVAEATLSSTAIQGDSEPRLPPPTAQATDFSQPASFALIKTEGLDEKSRTRFQHGGQAPRWLVS